MSTLKERLEELMSDYNLVTQDLGRSLCWLFRKRQIIQRNG